MVVSPCLAFLLGWWENEEKTNRYRQKYLGSRKQAANLSRSSLRYKHPGGESYGRHFLYILPTYGPEKEVLPLPSESPLSHFCHSSMSLRLWASSTPYRTDPEEWHVRLTSECTCPQTQSYFFKRKRHRHKSSGVKGLVQTLLPLKRLVWMLIVCELSNKDKMEWFLGLNTCIKYRRNLIHNLNL